MGSEEKDTHFKLCTHLISTNTSLAYCVNYHEWLTKCPNRCAFFKEGVPVDMNDLKKEKFNPECYYFTKSDSNDFIFQCVLFKQENPICESCQYLKLSNENKQIS